MKKAFVVVLAMVMALSMLVACGSDNENGGNGGNEVLSGSAGFRRDDLTIDERLVGRWYQIGYIFDDVFEAIDEGNIYTTWIFFEDGILLNDFDYLDWEIAEDGVVAIDDGGWIIDVPFEVIGNFLRFGSDDGIVNFTRMPSFLDGQNNNPLIGKWSIVYNDLEHIMVFFADGRKVRSFTSRRTNDGLTFENISTWQVGGSDMDELFWTYPGPNGYWYGHPFYISGDRLYITDVDGDWRLTSVFRKTTP